MKRSLNLFEFKMEDHKGREDEELNEI